MTQSHASPAFVLMGVSGCGKTTVGRSVSRQLGIPFLEGDDFHSDANVARMASGKPLNDDDRLPWIGAIAGAINAAPAGPVVVACSALSRQIRQRLDRDVVRDVEYIFLQGEMGTVTERLNNRQNHFAGSALVRSQFAALQIPSRGIAIDISKPLPQVCNEVAGFIRSFGR